MTPDATNRINEHFGNVVEDWTPSAARGAAQMLFAPVCADPLVSRFCATVLSDAELETAKHFKIESDRNRFMQRRAFRRFCAARALGSCAASLSEIAFDQTEKGMPFLRDSGASFSFSSCGSGLIGAWSFTHGIGIDIEDETRNVEATELAAQFFSESESRMVADAGDLHRTQIFFQLWSLKESALKSVGEGLPFGMDAFEFDLSPSLRIRRAPDRYGAADNFDPHIRAEKNFCAALVTRRLTVSRL